MAAPVRLAAMRVLPAALVGLLLIAMAAPMAVKAADFPSSDARYHTYAEMVAELNQAVADHGSIVRKVSIGKSYQGRDIWAAKISDNVATDESEPEVLFDGLHHARLPIAPLRRSTLRRARRALPYRLQLHGRRLRRPRIARPLRSRLPSPVNVPPPNPRCSCSFPSF